MSEFLKSLADGHAPPHILAALELFQFQSASADRLSRLTAPERSQFFTWCDKRQLTLALARAGGPKLPDWTLERVHTRTARYQQRFRNLKRDLLESAEALDRAGLEFVMLKGLSHAPALTPDPLLRAQGDIDLWLCGSSVQDARTVLSSLGYVPLLNSKSRHLPPMGRPSGWKWRGDLFDPGMPISIELHYELWSNRAEHLSIPGLQQFWERRKLRDFDGQKINVLSDEDLLGFAALHFLLHLLHGELPLQRAWEIAYFLDSHANDVTFWASCYRMHSSVLQQLEIFVFHLITRWFRCRLSANLGAALEELPSMVRQWLERYYLAPFAREWAPNKSEILLALALIDKPQDRILVLFKRLVPISLPAFTDRAETQRSSFAKALKVLRQWRLIGGRLVHHILTLMPALLASVRWLWLLQTATRPRGCAGSYSGRGGT